MYMRLLLIFCILWNSTSLFAQLNWQETNIPMSDGQSLKADIYLPDNWTSGPTILIQTPYNKNLYRLNLPIGIGQAQASMTYAIVIADWRGFYGSSNAAYQGSPTMGEDGYDVVEWIAAQSWSDGMVGTWGPSALGRVQYLTAKENPPHLKCIVPVVAAPTYTYNEFYPGGSYRVEYMQQIAGLGFGNGALVLANPYLNALWNITSNQYFYPDEIRVPTFMIAGWYDHNIDLMIPFFDALQALSPETVRDKHKMLIGPWVHGGHGFANPGSAMQGQLSYPNAANVNHQETWKFFDYHLKGVETGIYNQPAVQYYKMGENTWHQVNEWPVNTTSQYFYLHENGQLNSQIPTTTNGSLSYDYNPEDPSPTIGGPTLRADLDQGPYDQRFEVENRDDALIFTTDELSQPITLAGKAKLHLKVHSSVIDTDFTVRICDVYPDGRSMLVVDGIQRMRFRNGYTAADESFMTTGEMYECTIEMPHTALTFLEGHRIRIIVTSSNYPRFNRNMNTGGAMYPGLNGDVLINPLIARNTIHVSSLHASYLELPTLPPTITSTTEMNTSPILVYPNPATEHLTIDCNIEGAKHLVIMDAMGAIVHSEYMNNTTQRIATTSFAKGVYLGIISNGAKYYTFKFVVGD
jgi:predicted acyl esterase